ncbi:hypothetical protein HDV63DRAFT_345169 [Trichoderma sp. SZMC 28014]
MPSRELARLLVGTAFSRPCIGVDRILAILVVVTCWGKGAAASKSATWRRKKDENHQKQQKPGRSTPERGPDKHDEGGIKGEMKC